TSIAARRGSRHSNGPAVMSSSRTFRSRRSASSCAASWSQANTKLSAKRCHRRTRPYDTCDTKPRDDDDRAGAGAMSTPMIFTDPRLASLDGLRVEIDAARERADIVLDRPPFNIVSMPQRDQLRLAFEALDEDARVRVIVLRAVGEHFSSGGN